MRVRKPDCDACYGWSPEICGPNCTTSHIRYYKEEDFRNGCIALRCEEIPSCTETHCDQLMEYLYRSSSGKVKK